MFLASADSYENYSVEMYSIRMVCSSMKLERASDVHVWKIDLRSTALDPYPNVMSADEQARAVRYYTPQLQQHYSRGRCALRLLLASYLDVAATDIVFKYGPFGKPELDTPSDKGLHFNLSHSEQFALIAIASDVIGVDLEYMRRPDLDVKALIEIVLHPLEKAAFALHTAQSQVPFFYNIWSRKEAYCKARGVGLQATLSNLHIERGRATDIGRVLDESTAQATNFYSYSLALPHTDNSYSASVCLPIPDATITLRVWPGVDELCSHI